MVAGDPEADNHDRGAFLHTNGSVLIAALGHAATNAFLVSPTGPIDGDVVEETTT